MEVEAALRCKDPPRFLETGTEPSEVVVESVGVARAGLAFDTVMPAGKSAARCGLVRGGTGFQAGTCATGVEGGIDVDQTRASIGQRPQHLERLAEDDGGGAARRIGAELLRGHVE